MDYADQLCAENRNDVNFKCNYTRTMLCPNRKELKPKHEWMDPSRYESEYAAKKKCGCFKCPAGDKKVEMLVQETGIWTTIKCPVCGYMDFWSIGDGDALF